MSLFVFVMFQHKLTTRGDLGVDNCVKRDRQEVRASHTLNRLRMFRGFPVFEEEVAWERREALQPWR